MAPSFYHYLFANQLFEQTDEEPLLLFRNLYFACWFLEEAFLYVAFQLRFRFGLCNKFLRFFLYILG